MNANPVTILAIVLTVLGGGTVGLFVYQNATRTTQLSLDLGFYAVQLQQEVMIPALMGICLVAGFLLGAVIFGYSAASARSRARRLEQELALSGGGSGDGWK